MLTTDELTRQLRQFTGTGQWYRHALTGLLYTDGVRFFAENGGVQGAYWLLDMLLINLFAAQQTEPFITVTVKVAGDKAMFTVENGNGKAVKSTLETVEFTDLQPGEWMFWLTDKVLLLPSEY